MDSTLTLALHLGDNLESVQSIGTVLDNSVVHAFVPIPVDEELLSKGFLKA